MTKIILLDLDDTLLNNNMDAFQVAYLKALGKHLSPYIRPDLMIKELLAGTQKMIENRRPSLTLRSVFNQRFYPAIGIKLSELQPVIDQFYEDVFPSLRPYTSPKPEAISFVAKCQSEGYRLVVATNPLFPRSAILQRIQWAGFDPNQFDLITCYEEYHFAKPSPAFYFEILGRLGYPSEPAVMVGNDLEADIVPAAIAGLSTHWLTDSSAQAANSPDCSGSFDAAWEWIQGSSAPAPNRTLMTPQSLISSLSATPASLGWNLQTINGETWQTRSQPSEWSLVEIICHLRDIERELHQAHFKLGSGAENAFLPAISTDAWPSQRQYARQDGITALNDFIALREETISMLADLPGQTWSQPVRHGIFGPTSFKEVVEYAWIHDIEHIRQAWRILSALGS